MSKVLAKFQIKTPEEMNEFGLKVSKVLQAGDLVILTGPLGAGKTTFTRGVGEGLRAIGNVSSPTFVIARTHKCTDSEIPLVHVDAYRLGSVNEFDDLDIDVENSIVLVEWGRGFAEDLSETWLDVEIERDHTGETDVRTVTLTGVGNRWEAETRLS